MHRLLSPYGLGAVIGLLLCWLSFWNGYPLIYEDTAAYLNRPATLVARFDPDLAGPWAQFEKVERLNSGKDQARAVATADADLEPGYDGRIKAGRSIYYGMLAFVLDRVANLWGVIAFQGWIVGTCVALLTVRCLRWESLWPIAGLAAVLAFGTAAVLFVNVVMPDVYTATLVLAVAMLAAYWDRFNALDRLFLASVALLGCLSHESNLLVCLAMGGGLLLARLLHRAPPLARNLIRTFVVVLVVVVGGVASSFAFNKMVATMSGYPPSRLPHLTAHVVSLPLGVEYLDANCATRKWAVCAFRDRLPVVWTDFLFEKSPERGTFAAAPSRLKQRVSDEDFALAADVVLSRPAKATAEMARSVVRQTVSFSYVDFVQGEKRRFVEERFPLSIARQVAATRLWSNGLVLDALSGTQVVLVACCVVLLPLSLWVLAAMRLQETTPFLVLSALVVLGVLANATICGVLASPYDRFQARIIWLIPLLTYCALVLVLRDRRVHSIVSDQHRSGGSVDS